MTFSKICVIGLGYIGLPTACMFANTGVSVVGVDINSEIIRNLNNGKIHLNEDGLHSAFQRASNSGRLKVGQTPEKADAFIIAVPTPHTTEKKADMRAVISAVEMVVPYLEEGNLVILESTSPPLTTKRLVKPILEKTGLIAGEDFYLAYSPERVLPGKILQELITNARVIGGINQRSAIKGAKLYRTFVEGEIVVTDATTAEMVKLMENTYRDVNISIANEFSRLAHRFGINIWEAISIANKHPRVEILKPGPGVGGHCISVDPWFLVEAAPDLANLIKAARFVNDSQPNFVLEWIKDTLGTITGKHLAILGLAFKADVDDLRESPAIEIAQMLASQGAIVKAFEPNKPNAIVENIYVTSSLRETISGTEAIILLVGHRQFRDLTPDIIANMTNTRLIFDVVNALENNPWQGAGFEVMSLGNIKMEVNCKESIIEK
jgi:UDP-N-acetyl-D-mannosaminuronic acid dehydrogenase